MSLSAATVWEVRTTGSDSNSGGFVAGASGSDFSQQDAPEYSATDLASSNGNASSPQVTSASHSFVAADVGNILRITIGASWSAGFYQIVSVSGGAATLDRACGSSASLSGGSYVVGGAFASPGQAGQAFVAGNHIYIKSGTYTITSATVNVAGGCVSLANQPNASYTGRIIGYGSVRDDNGARPLLQASGITSFRMIALGLGDSAENIAVDGAGLSSSQGFNGSNSRFYNCKAMNCTNTGIQGGEVLFCEATGCSGAAAINCYYAFGCVSHDNSIYGFGSGNMIVHCLSYNNTIGFLDGFSASRMIHCTAANNSSHGFYSGITSATAPSSYINVISYGNGGYGIYCAGNANVFVNNVFLGNNTSGNSTGFANFASIITLTANPFNDSASGDFSLNNTPGGGALIRASSLPSVFPGTALANYLDGGALQHQDSGGGPTIPMSRVRLGM